MAQRGQPDVPGRHDGVRNDLLLDAARVLMLFGAAAAIGSPSANPTQAFLGLLLWLLGVFLLEALVPAAGRFLHAALFATVAMAIAYRRPDEAPLQSVELARPCR